MLIVITIFAAKFAALLSRWFGRGDGSALPGLVAQTLDPKILTKLGQQIEGGITLVTGTNGKTTTTKLLREALEADGQVVISNQAGSNLYRGLVSALIMKASPRGTLPSGVGLFEVDEAAMPEVAAALQPKLIVVLNLFRDQLDRYGELDRTAELINRAIAATSADLCLNADDPLVAYMGHMASKGRKVRYFGIEAAFESSLAHDYTADSIHDPQTGEPLDYSQVYFGHMGHYLGGKGGFSRPKPNFAITKLGVLGHKQSEVSLQVGQHQHQLKVGLPGLYNLYNALAVVAASEALRLPLAATLVSIEQSGPAFGRVEQISWRGHMVFLLLIKNPTGFNQIIQTFLMDKSGESVLLMVNDNFADGRDVSWLWDAALEDIASKQHRIITAGIRAYDMALRLKYAGVDFEEVVPDPVEALDKLVNLTPPGEPIYVLPTYTAMLGIRKVISAEAGLGRMGE